MSDTCFRAVHFAAFLFAMYCWPVIAQEPVAVPVQPLLSQGDSAFAQGDYDAARRLFGKAQIAQQLPSDSPLRYEVLRRLALASAASGQFVDAARYLEQAVKWRESTSGPKDSKIVDDLLLLINLKMRTKEFDQALAIAQRVQAMHVEAYTPESIPVADDLLRIGQIYLAQKKPHRVQSLAEGGVGELYVESGGFGLRPGFGVPKNIDARDIGNGFL